VESWPNPVSYSIARKMACQDTWPTVRHKTFPAESIPLTPKDFASFLVKGSWLLLSQL
jgi:hypothetical protein